MKTNIQFPAGISGFYLPHQAPPQLTSFAQLEATCQVAENSGFWRVLRLSNHSTLRKPSYHLALLEEVGTLSKYLVFCNRYHPFYALGEVMEDIQPPYPPVPLNKFTEQPSLQHFFDSHFTFLPPDLLEIKVDADDEENAPVVALLTNHEFAEFSFWEPRIMGDIVFNNWG